MAEHTTLENDSFFPTDGINTIITRNWCTSKAGGLHFQTLHRNPVQQWFPNSFISLQLISFVPRTNLLPTIKHLHINSALFIVLPFIPTLFHVCCPAFPQNPESTRSHSSARAICLELITSNPTPLHPPPTIHVAAHSLSSAPSLHLQTKLGWAVVTHWWCEHVM